MLNPISNLSPFFVASEDRHGPSNKEVSNSEASNRRKAAARDRFIENQSRLATPVSIPTRPSSSSSKGLMGKRHHVSTTSFKGHHHNHHHKRDKKKGGGGGRSKKRKRTPKHLKLSFSDLPPWRDNASGHHQQRRQKVSILILISHLPLISPFLPGGRRFPGFRRGGKIPAEKEIN